MLKAKLKPAIRERKFPSGSLAFGQTLVSVDEVDLVLRLGLGVSKVSKVLCKKFLDTNVTSDFRDNLKATCMENGNSEIRRQLRRSCGIFQGYPLCKESRLVMSQACGKRSDSSSLIL